MSEDVSKLPKWAQERIRTLERERETAILALNEYINKQAPSPIYYDDHLSTGEGRGPTQKRVYIQTKSITIEHAGVELEITLRKGVIDLQWSQPGWITGPVAFVPQSYQKAHLVAPENMR